MIKKIMSVLASTVMLGSTIIFASAASTTDIFGSNTLINAPGPLDAPAANSMGDYMASLNIGETTNQTTTINETIIDGEIEAIKTSSQPLYLDDMMSETKSTFTKTQLPIVLASGEVDGDNRDYEYNLKIDVPDAYTRYGEPEGNMDKAIIHTDFSGDENYKLRIIFPTAVDVNELAGESIRLFGRDYTFSEDESDLSYSSIDLFEKSTIVTIKTGETKVIDGHSIRADVEDTDSATIYVDGISKNVNDESWSGKIGGVNIYVKNIHAPNVAGDRYVEISLNTEKLVLSDGDEVERGTRDIDGTDVEIKTSGTGDNIKVKEIVITVTPSEFDDEVEHLAVGDYIIDPVFETIKFSLDSVTPDLESDDRDYIKVRTSGDDAATIGFTNKAGKEYSFEFIDDDDVTFLNENIPEDGYFITGSNEYTQIWQVENIRIDGDEKEIRLRDQAKDSDSVEIDFDGDTGELTLADGNTAIISGVTKDSINVSNIVDYVYTEKGAKITFDFGIETTTTTTCENYLPNTVNLSSCVLEDTITYPTYNMYLNGTWYINDTVTIDDYYTCEDYPIELEDPNNCTETIDTEVGITRLVIKEETDYNGGSFTDNDGTQLGSEIVIDIKNLGNDDDLSLKLLGYDYSRDDTKYLTTRYGTYVTDDDGEKVEIYYPEEAMSIEFHIGEVGSQITTTTTTETNINEGKISKIILGGTCVNGEASRLLGVGQLCGADFTAITGVSTNQALIQVFADTNDKIAILVAGYETADTLRATNYLKNNYNTMDLNPGSKLIV